MKLYNLSIIKREMAMEVLDLMTDGLNTLLRVDDVLPVMAAPITRLDFENVQENELTTLMRSVRSFMKHWKRIEGYNKLALINVLTQNWLPNLNDSTKLLMLSESKLIEGVSDDGYVHISEKNFNAYSQIREKGTFSHIEYGSGSSSTPRSRSLNVIGKGDFKEYVLREINGKWSVDLPISEEEWYEIIKAATVKVKEYLSCVIQLAPKEFSCAEIEHKFGFNPGSVNARNNALGRLAMNMMGNFVITQEDAPDSYRIWPIAMNNGHNVQNEYGVVYNWEARPEMVAAARKVLKEEDFPLLKQV